MFRSTPAKIIFVLLIILGFMQLTAKVTVEKQSQENTQKLQQQKYSQQLQQSRENKKIVNANNAQRKHNLVLDAMGRSLTSIQNYVEDFRNVGGDWPEDLTDMGMQSETAVRSKYIQSVKIDNGEIYAFLAPQFGDNKILRMYYKAGTWNCTTNLLLAGKKTIARMPCSEDPDVSFNGRYIQ
ncbi:MAG: hypothetical protein OQK69_06565 [Gammaproteobacteria bacterium]|nr:hypothetical protein [Gammaproteobacteria bacterium]